ncbi:MAG: flagellin [Cellulosilyticaceae bacterium]
MRINHNIPALRTLNQLEKVNNKTAATMERLSSGLRINSAADDAAGMAIANKMDAQIRGLSQANRNTMDGISMLQTAEGALNETHAILQRMRELSVQAANETNSDEDITQIQQEIEELRQEISRISNATEFNNKPLLNGTLADVKLQVGSNEGQVMVIPLDKMDPTELGIDNIDVTIDPDSAITVLDTAIATVSSQRGRFGAAQNRLEHTANNLGSSEENLTSALSRIQDADMAYEMAQFTQQNVLSQAATAMLAQANQRPQQVLQLLQR